VLVAIAVAMTMRAMVIETYYVPSESMLPTLLVGDHMLVNKFAYGARIPFTSLRLPAVRQPERGDVVTFVLGRSADGRICPADRCPDYPVEGFVKRIVGLPGDTVEVQGDRVRLNGTELAVVFDADSLIDEMGNRLRIGRETLPGSATGRLNDSAGREDSSHAVLDDPMRGGLNQVRITIPEGRYFVLGDNRDFSNDSRGWGTVGRDELKGPVTRIYWSWNNRETWSSMLNPLTWWRLLREEMRWERTGMRVE
jgi:signal peptidase I